MSTPTGVAASQVDCILAFDGNNRLAVRPSKRVTRALAFPAGSLADSLSQLESCFAGHTVLLERFRAESSGQGLQDPPLPSGRATLGPRDRVPVGRAA